MLGLVGSGRVGTGRDRSGGDQSSAFDRCFKQQTEAKAVSL
jgi:hypothetical protein